MRDRALDRAGIDALGLPKRKERVAAGIFANRGEVADLGALPGGGDGDVGRVPAMALLIEHAAIIRCRELVIFQQRLADAEKIDCHLRDMRPDCQVEAMICSAAAVTAARSPAATSPSSQSLPPMPTKLAPAAR